MSLSRWQKLIAKSTPNVVRAACAGALGGRFVERERAGCHGAAL